MTSREVPNSRDRDPSNQSTAHLQGQDMKLKIIVHEAEEGGYWAEVPSIPGCATQGETFEELLTNLYDAVESCLAVDLTDISTSATDRILEIAV
jgi:predicted RNase H-like HicB family nuclease